MNNDDDVVGRVIHWEVCKEYGVECSDKWYEHSPKSVEEKGYFPYFVKVDLSLYFCLINTKHHSIKN